MTKTCTPPLLLLPNALIANSQVCRRQHRRHRRHTLLQKGRQYSVGLLRKKLLCYAQSLDRSFSQACNQAGGIHHRVLGTHHRLRVTHQSNQVWGHLLTLSGDIQRRVDLHKAEHSFAPLVSAAQVT